MKLKADQLKLIAEMQKIFKSKSHNEITISYKKAFTGGIVDITGNDYQVSFFDGIKQGYDEKFTINQKLDSKVITSEDYEINPISVIRNKGFNRLCNKKHSMRVKLESNQCEFINVHDAIRHLNYEDLEKIEKTCKKFKDYTIEQCSEGVYGSMSNTLSCSVRIESDKAVITDGSRLEITEIHSQPIGDNQINIRKTEFLKVYALLKKLLKRNKTDIVAHISKEGDQYLIFFSTGGANFNISIKPGKFSGKFPNYDCVIPKDNKNILLLDKGQVLTAIRQANVIRNDRFPGLRFSANPVELENKIELKTSNPEIGDFIYTADCSVNFVGEFVVNLDYLRDSLKTINSEIVQISQGDRIGKSALLIADYMNPSINSIVMPMQLDKD